MKILADENITNVAESFAPYGEVFTVPGRSITDEMLNDVDALLVRSITRVDASLLSNSRCRFVGTATSGIDHVDVAALQARGITLGWAQGCNSISVVDYVFSAFAHLSRQTTGLLAVQDWRNCSVGIIGCGQIGGALAQRLSLLGMSFRVYDPFLTENHHHSSHVTTMEEALRQDIITLHVPFTIAGPWPTFHMLNDRTLARIRKDSVLINAARGAVIDNRALLEWIDESREQTVVLDTWENEPNIDLQLLQKVQIGTPHIAGYSHEGKLKGTRMLVEQFCRYLGNSPPVAIAGSDHTDTLIPVDADSKDQLNQLMLAAYDIGNDDQAMRGLLQSDSSAQAFDNLRKRYPVRHEFSHFKVSMKTLHGELKTPLQALGFQLVD